jgi:putative membrane protein
MPETTRSDLTTILLVVLGLLVLWPLLMMGLGGMGMMGYGGMMSGPYSDGGYSIVGVALQFVFVILFLGGGFLLARRFIGHRETKSSRSYDWPTLVVTFLTKSLKPADKRSKQMSDHWDDIFPSSWIPVSCWGFGRCALRMRV